jgi:hypothetical protein
VGGLICWLGLRANMGRFCFLRRSKTSGRYLVLSCSLQVFTTFLRHVGFDHSLLLDFLISDETSFLAYFVR